MAKTLKWKRISGNYYTAYEGDEYKHTKLEIMRHDAKVYHYRVTIEYREDGNGATIKEAKTAAEEVSKRMMEQSNG